MKPVSIEIVGVGGQGILLASQIIGEAAMRKQVNVLMSEVHGMAQRGGVVTTSVRLGDVTSPLIGDGEADIILGFEPVETYRSLAKGNPDTWIITSTAPIVPTTVSAGRDKYPEVAHLVSQMRAAARHVVPIDAIGLAKEAGAAIAANVVLVGALAGCEQFPLGVDAMREAALSQVPAKFRDVNAKAFDLGVKATSCPTR